jgi:hypothetical protein
MYGLTGGTKPTAWLSDKKKKLVKLRKKKKVSLFMKCEIIYLLFFLQPEISLQPPHHHFEPLN